MSITLTSPAGTILRPGDPGWDDARRAWNLTADQRPAAIAFPRSAADVGAAVGFARRCGLRVAAHGTGHNTEPVNSLTGTLLIETSKMRQVAIDPAAMTARAAAGASWGEVTAAAARHGLTGLAASWPGVGVVGYTLGGGMSWFGRSHGLSANNVSAVELVTADGQLRRVHVGSESDLFWAVRGGGGSFGVVTAIELWLFPVTEVYAGQLWWLMHSAPSVLPAWRELTQSGLPDEFTTSVRLMRFPVLPHIPEAVRGRWFVIVDVVHNGPAPEADQILQPLRALAPVRDTVCTRPAGALGGMREDYERPVPGVADGLMLASLPPEAVDRILLAAGPGTLSLLTAVELRLAGGELRRARPGNGALAAVDGQYLLSAAGRTATPAAAVSTARGVEAVISALRPWSARQMYLNIAGPNRDPASFWPARAYARLRRIKAAVDPGNLIRSNHPIPPAAT